MDGAILAGQLPRDTDLTTDDVQKLRKSMSAADVMRRDGVYHGCDIITHPLDVRLFKAIKAIRGLGPTITGGFEKV